MEHQKLESVTQPQFTAGKKPYQAPRLIEQGTWTASTGQALTSEALGGVGNDVGAVGDAVNDIVGGTANP